MALFEITDDGLVKQDVESFSGLRLKEREDLQRVLRDQIDALGEDLLVLCHAAVRVGIVAPHCPTCGANL